MNMDLFNVLICVDSKSVLESLIKWDNKSRKDLIFDIRYLIHCIRTKGTGLTFCWIPSHCGLYWNEEVDRLAKNGALKKDFYVDTTTYMFLNANEINTALTKKVNKDLITNKADLPSCTRYLSSFIYRMRLNAWKTKYVNVRCFCGNTLSVHHVFFDCQLVKKALDDHGARFHPNIKNVNEILYNIQESTMFSISIVLQSEVGKLL